MFRSVLSTDLSDLPAQVGSSVSSGPAPQAGGQCVFCSNDLTDTWPMLGIYLTSRGIEKELT